MKKIIFILAASLLIAWNAFSESEPTVVKISAQPLHDGLATPLLYGNFIELLDDLVPGMRAEMLNNRGFEGITRPANWAYYDGSLNMCDREWKKSYSVEDTANPFNGARCMKMTVSVKNSASITQEGLAVELNGGYNFSGYFRADNTNVEATVILKTKLPDGNWWELGRTRLPDITKHWKKLNGNFRANGVSDQVVFELRVTGIGEVQVDQVSLMPESNRFGWRADVVEAIKEAHPAVLRWGGSVCDPGGYKWRDGIGDRDKRPSFNNKVWGRTDANEVGIDEFCQLCRLVGAQPLICVSFADGAQSAGDLVRYCNDPETTPPGVKRKSNGYATPYHVVYWQIGNEISGDDENYLRQVTAFGQAIKSAYSAAALLSSFPSQKLLTTAGKNLDYICPHQYTADLAACEKEFERLGAMIRGTPDCDKIKLAVTEWNTSAGGWGLQRGNFLTLENALKNARYLNLLLRHSDLVEIANRSNLANSMGSGIFETSSARVLRRPSFYVMQLYANHATFKRTILKLENAPADVDMVATKLEHQPRVAIFAVNMKTEPVAIKLDLTELGDGFHVGNADAVCDTLDARQPDVMNHWNSAKRVSIVPVKVDGDKIILPALSATVIEGRASHE